MVSRMAPRLVERDRELARVESALVAAARDPESAVVVTITGGVGVGKTTLARRMATQLAHRGVFDAVTWRDAASPAVDGLDPGGASAPLVVLDGCDTVTDPAALVASVLERHPGASVLATARVPLRLPGEIVIELAPLETPRGDDPRSPALACLAVHLPDGACDALVASDPAAVAALLRELDGLPLAIALAAPRLALMDARALLHRLHRSRSLLERPGADVAERRPLEAALTGALQALAPRARAALAALTSLAGAGDLAALEAIVGPPLHPGDARALDVLAELRERGLLVPVGDPEGRLAILRCVRDVVLRMADRADVEGGRERHADHFAQLAQALHRRAVQGDGEAARTALRDARDDLVLVLERLVAAPVIAGPAADRALRLLVAVYGVPDGMPPSSFLAIVDAAVTRTRDSGADPELVAQALVVRARALRAAGDASRATRDLLRALPMAMARRRRDVEADATLQLAQLFADRAELADAIDHARRASIAFREAGDPVREAVAAALVADLERRRGDPAAASDAVERALALARLRGAPAEEVVLAAVRLHLEVGDARALAEVVTATSAALPGDRRWTAVALLVEAIALHDRGEVVAARERHARAGEAARAALATQVEAEVALFDGLAALALGRRGDAMARLRVASELGGAGTVAQEVDEAARAIAFALDAWTTPRWKGTPPIVRRSRVARLLVGEAEAGRGVDEVATALRAEGDDRVLGRLLLAALGASTPARVEDDVDAARFSVDGRWFRLPTEPVVSLERRRPLAGMLELLVAERLARPGAPVSVEMLLAAGWPGERVRPDAGAHRVRVALSTLRKLGLRGLLLTTGAGYALDPARKVRTAAEGAG